MRRNRSVLGLVAGALLILFFQWYDPSTQQPVDDGERITCVVSRITDGDSIECRGGDRVRLLSIDAPELAQDPYGELAQGHLASLLPLGTRASLELDIEYRDDHDRILAYLYLPDGRMINEVMARAGYVVDLVYRPNTRYADRIRDAVDEARDARRGLWARGAFECRPRDFRAYRCGR